MTNNLYRIVRRAHSEYVTVATHQGTYLQALSLAGWYEQHPKFGKQGEYLVREITEDDWRPGSSYQSGMDWL